MKRKFENLDKRLAMSYMDFMENLFLNFFVNYPYDLKYIKKLIKDADKERKKGKMIVAENIDEALRIFKRKK